MAALAGQLQSSQSDTDGAEDPYGAEEDFEPDSGYGAEPAGSSPARLQNRQNMEVRCASCCGLWLLELTAACPMLLAGQRQNFLAMIAVLPAVVATLHHAAAHCCLVTLARIWQCCSCVRKVMLHLRRADWLRRRLLPLGSVLWCPAAYCAGYT